MYFTVNQYRMHILFKNTWNTHKSVLNLGDKGNLNKFQRTNITQTIL